MFSSKMVILKGIWTFLLSRYHITVETSDDPLSLDHLVISGYASHGAHGAHGHLFGCGRLGPIRLHLVIVNDVEPRLYSSGIFNTPWRMKLGSVLSGPHRSLIAFTLSASVEGGCKRIGRIPKSHAQPQLLRQSITVNISILTMKKLRSR